VSMYQVGESTIGGNAAGARNVISANSSRAVSMSRVDYNDVTGNYIGTDVTGSADLGNGVYGNYIGTNAAGDAAIPNGGGCTSSRAPNSTTTPSGASRPGNAT
jgi:hypothetical protein